MPFYPVPKRWLLGLVDRVGAVRGPVHRSDLQGTDWTIREFAFAVLLVPTLVSYFWFTMTGDNAIRTVLDGDTQLVDVLNQDNGLDVVFFAFLERYPFAIVTSTVAVISVFIFFVTSSDSGSLVIDMLTSGGAKHPPTAQRIFWAVSEGAVAAALLLAGGLEALRAAVVALGLPCAILLILICYSLIISLRGERKGLSLKEIAEGRKEPARAAPAGDQGSS